MTNNSLFNEGNSISTNDKFTLDALIQAYTIP